MGRRGNGIDIWIYSTFDCQYSLFCNCKYHKEKTQYTKYKIDKSLTYTFTLTYGDTTETVTDFSQIEYAIKRLAKYRTGLCKA